MSDFESQIVKPSRNKVTRLSKYGKSSEFDISVFDSDGKKKSQATLLIEIGMNGLLFHDVNRDAYVEIKSGGVFKTFKVRSRDYKEYLGHELFKLIDKGANSTAITDAINTLEAVAKHDGDEFPVAIRVFNHDSSVYIDPGCEARKIIKINKNGWQYVVQAPVKFVRKNGMTAMRTPSAKGNIQLIRKYINVNDDEFPLLYAWLFCALAGITPYPILILQGEQGTGKSTTSRVIRLLSDPSSVPLRAPPKELRDMLVAACNTHAMVLDNLSGLSPEMSDLLCRLSTGGGIDVRALYTDNEQVLMELQKPILCNGIDDIAIRPDLTERSLIINLPIINGKKRKSEFEFWQEFETDQPKIQSALFKAISSGFQNQNNIQLEEKPRMADAVQWVSACEKGLGLEGDFLEAYNKNQKHAIELGIDSSPVGSAIMALMADRKTWLGKPTELMARLEEIAGERQIRSKSWPQSPKGLNNAIKRLMPNFRKLGIEIIKYDFGNREYRLENIRK